MKRISILLVLLCNIACSTWSSDETSPDVVESDIDLRDVNKGAPPFDNRKRRKQLNRGSQ